MAITLDKAGTPNPVQVGQTLTYTIIINSLGPGPANNVVLTDVLPATVTFVSASVPCTLVGNTLTCNLGNIPAGTSRTITITVTPNAVGTITNTATAQGSGQNFATDTETTQVITAATLALTKGAPATVTVGIPFDYLITVSNAGPATATNVVVTDLLPASVTVNSFPAGCTPVGNLLTCNLGNLATGETRQITVNITANQAGTITNTVTAQGANTAPTTATATTEVVAAPTLATIVLTKEAPATAVVGQAIEYLITVRNLGPSAAMNVVVTDVLPAGVTLLNSGSCTPVGNVVTCNVGRIPVGEERLVLLVVRVDQPGPSTNVASAQGSNTNVATATATTQVLAATTLTITKAGAPNPAAVGGTRTYTITVTNTTALPAVNALLTDTLPANVEFIAASLPCTLGPGNLLTCNLGTIPGNGTVTVTIQVRPTEPGAITNEATVVAANAVAVTAVEVTQVRLEADLAVTKIANARAQVGQGLTYTVTVTNNGPSTATGVVLVDDLPAGVRFIAATPSQGTCSIAGSRLTCLPGTLTPGETATVTILVVPTRPGILTNTAFIFSDVVDPNPANNTASVTVTVFQCCDPFIC